jgi:hypothetical protein
VHDGDPRGAKPEQGQAALGVARHQEKEGNDETREDQQDADVHVAAAPPPPKVVVGRLLGDPRVPDQHELREADVGPEHDEAVEELAEIVKVLDRHRLADEPVAPHPEADQDDVPSHFKHPVR